MKLRKVISMVLVVVMTMCLLLTGCSGSESNTSEKGSSEEGSSEVDSSGGEKVQISFWTMNTKQGALEEIVKSFNEENEDIEVIISYYDGDPLKDALKVAASSKTLPNMWFIWGGSLGSFYVENGVTYDMTEYAKEHNWEGQFTSAALELCTLEDQLAGYPTGYNAVNMWYRKDIFEEYGIEVPTTFEEFEEVCATLKGNGITPLATGGLWGWHTMRYVEVLFEYYTGEELHDKLNTFDESWDNEYVVQALAKYQEFCEKGYFPDGFITADPDEMTLTSMLKGTCAMDIQGQWHDGTLLSEEADLELFGTFAFPSGGTNRVSAFADMTQFNINNSDEELDACVKFMDYTYSDEYVKAYPEYFSLPTPRIGSEVPEGQPHVQDIMTTAENNGTFTITDQAFPTEIVDGLFNVQEGIANGKMTPEEGAAAIQKAVDNYKK